MPNKSRQRANVATSIKALFVMLYCNFVDCIVDEAYVNSADRI